MNFDRHTTPLPSSAVYWTDTQCSALAQYVAYKGHSLGLEELYQLSTDISPDCIIHVANVEGDPDSFYFEQFDPRCLYKRGENFAGKSVLRACDPSSADIIMDSYIAARDGSSQFSKEVVLSGPGRIFVRYVTPLRTNGVIKQILICSRYQMIANSKNINLKFTLPTYQQIEKTLSENNLEELTTRLCYDAADEIKRLRSKLLEQQEPMQDWVPVNEVPDTWKNGCTVIFYDQAFGFRLARWRELSGFTNNPNFKMLSSWYDGAEPLSYVNETLAYRLKPPIKS